MLLTSRTRTPRRSSAYQTRRRADADVGGVASGHERAQPSRSEAPVEARRRRLGQEAVGNRTAVGLQEPATMSRDVRSGRAAARAPRSHGLFRAGPRRSPPWVSSTVESDPSRRTARSQNAGRTSVGCFERCVTTLGRCVIGRNAGRRGAVCCVQSSVTQMRHPSEVVRGARTSTLTVQFGRRTERWWMVNSSRAVRRPVA